MSLPAQSDPPQKGVSSQIDKRATPFRPRGIRPLTWILLLAIIGPCAVQFVPHEIGRWHLAHAIRLRENGQKEAAYQELAAALQRFPDNPTLLLRRAEWRLADGKQEEALADGEQAQALAKDEPGILMKHAELLQKAGKFDQAVENWKLVEDFSRRSGDPPREDALNGLAYAQSLAKVELDDALRNVTAAIDLLPSEEPKDPVKQALHVLNRAQFLDTRGYILHLLGRNEQAITDMDNAVNALSQAHRALGELIKSTADKSASPSSKEAQLSFNDARSSAVIHYHRSLVLNALDRKEDAEKDVETVRKLIGREPDETLF